LRPHHPAVGWVGTAFRRRSDTKESVAVEERDSIISSSGESWFSDACAGRDLQFPRRALVIRVRFMLCHG